MDAYTPGKATLALIRREFLLEWRQKYALGGIALYLGTVVFLVAANWTKPDPQTWILLYWIAVLFTAANAAARSFMGEGPAQTLYLYSLASAESVILAKSLYNIVLLLGLSLFGLAFYGVLLGFPIERSGTFLLAVLTGSTAFALVFSMVSAIGSKTKGTGAMMAILGFPILLPVVNIMSSLGRESLIPGGAFEGAEKVISLLAVDILILVLALVLFPYLWRD